MRWLVISVLVCACGSASPNSVRTSVADAGADNSPGVVDGGAAGIVPVDGGVASGSPDGGTLSGPIADGGIAGIDGGNDGGFPAECAGLTPRVPGAPTGIHSMQTTPFNCGTIGGDGSGILAFAANPDNSEKITVDFVSSDGTLVSRISEDDPFMVSQLSGFEGWVVGNDPVNPVWALRLWNADGSIGAQRPPQPGAPQDVVEDPLGGIVVLIRTSGPPRAESYDGNLNLRWRVDLPDRPMGAVAVDRAGNTLVLFDADDIAAPMAADAVWIDRAGHAGPVFRALPRQGEWAHISSAIVQRVGSGLFYGVSEWRQIDSLSTSPQPAPDWFTKHLELSGVHMVHGGRGYALISPQGGSDHCTQTVEVVAPSGVSCGTATFVGGPGGGPGLCPAGLVVTYDGTVVQRLPPSRGECVGQNCTCHWQWWSGFFR